LFCSSAQLQSLRILRTKPTLVAVRNAARSLASEDPDSDASKVNFTPVSKTVEALVALPAPQGNSETSRLNEVEETTFTVRARLVGYKHRTDKDFHIVIADLQNPTITMIVEIPDPQCAGVCASPKLQEIQQAREKFVQPFPTAQPSPQFVVVQGNVEVEVTGVGFFDSLMARPG